MILRLYILFHNLAKLPTIFMNLAKLVLASKENERDVKNGKKETKQRKTS